MDALDREFNEMCDVLGKGIGCAPFLPENEAVPQLQTIDEPYVAVPPEEQARRVSQLRAFADRLGLGEPTPPRNNAATQSLLAAMQAQWDAQRKRPGSWGPTA